MKTARQIINYIENEAEIAIPVNEFFNSIGGHITKKEYGKILIKYLVKELEQKFIDNESKRSN